MDKASALQQCSFYSQAPRSLQAQIESVATWTHLAEGQAFVHEGARCPQFAVLISGRLRVFKASTTGREITLYHVSAGQTCLANMLCTFLGTPSPASAIAEEPVDALVMPAASFRRWMSESDSTREFVFQAIANRFIDLMTLVEEITFRKMDRRLADFLLQSFVKEGFHLRELTSTHEAIAMELGSAREVVSRLLKEFERLGAIRIARGRIVLKDAHILQSMGRDPAVD